MWYYSFALLLFAAAYGSTVSKSKVMMSTPFCCMCSTTFWHDFVLIRSVESKKEVGSYCFLYVLTYGSTETEPKGGRVISP